MPASERLRLINSFVYTIYFLSTGSYKNKVRDFIIDTFNEYKNRIFNEELAIFGLNLFNLNIIQSNDLAFVLENLRELAKSSLEQKSYSSAYPTIKELLLNVDSPKLMEEYSEVLRDVSKICEALERSPFYRHK